MAIKQSYILKELKQLGFKNIKVESAAKLTVMLESGARRIDSLEMIEKHLDGIGAKYNPTGSGSTIGRVEIDNHRIFAKPANRQGGQSAGIENELKFIEFVNSVCNGEPTDVVFTSKNNPPITFKNVAKAAEMGRATANYAKSDVDFVDKNGRKIIGISLKQNDAQSWGAWDADTKAMQYVKKMLYKADSEKKIKLVEKNGTFSIERPGGGKANLAFPVEDYLAYDSIFGRVDDKKLIIVKQTFLASHFKVKDGTIYIECTKVYKDLNQIKRDNDDAPVWNVMNSQTRNPSALQMKGMRPLVQTKSRIRSSIFVK
jgi:hypothetical protein